MCGSICKVTINIRGNMLYLVNVFGIILVLPIVSIGINVFINFRKKIENNFPEIIGNWFIFWSIGIRLFTAGLMQIFNPNYTANLLQLNLNDLIVIRELGLSNSSIGLLGIISFFKYGLQKYVCLYILIFFSGASIIHITRLLQHTHFDEIITLITNVFIIFVSVYGIIRNIKTEKNIR
jgi:hypothetical protein